MAAISGRSAPVGDAGDGCFGVEQAGELASAGGGGGEVDRRARGVAVGPAGEGDAGPLHAQRAGVGRAVGGIVQHGERVVEQVFHAHAEAVEVAPGGGREVGAALWAVLISAEAVVAEPGGEHVCAALDQVPSANMLRESSLRFRRAFPQVLSRGKPQVSLEHVWPTIADRTPKQAAVRFPVKPPVIERPIGVANKPCLVGRYSIESHVPHYARVEP